MKKPIITIAGSLGSGKSSTAKAVAEALGFKHFSSGDLFRQIAAERGISLEEINLTAEIQQEIDHTVDGLLQEMGRTQENLVIDSRMAWHWIPDSFKVFLFLDPETSADRIFADIQSGKRKTEESTTLDEVRANIDRRFASEQKRYAALYGVNPTDPTHFDLVINTKENDLQTVISKVLATYKLWRET